MERVAGSGMVTDVTVNEAECVLLIEPPEPMVARTSLRVWPASWVVKAPVQPAEPAVPSLAVPVAVKLTPVLAPRFVSINGDPAVAEHV